MRSEDFGCCWTVTRHVGQDSITIYCHECIKLSFRSWQRSDNKGKFPPTNQYSINSGTDSCSWRTHFTNGPKKKKNKNVWACAVPQQGSKEQLMGILSWVCSCIWSWFVIIYTNWNLGQICSLSGVKTCSERIIFFNKSYENASEKGKANIWCRLQQTAKHINVIANVSQRSKTYTLWKITLNLSGFNCCTQHAGNSFYT